MDKLDKFYRIRADFPDWMTEEEWHKKEIEIIKECLEPQISQQMKSLLQGVKSPLSVSVEYSEDGTVSVKLTRKGDKEEKEEEKTPDGNGKRYGSRSESVGFIVCFPDGTTVQRSRAKDTLIATLKVIGLNRVAAFRGRTFSGIPLVTRTRREGGNAKWQEYVDGWYVYVNMSNPQKMDVLHKLSNEFNLGLVIKTEDGKTVTDIDATHEKGKRQMFLLDGRGPLNKRNCVWETISKYMKRNPSTTSQQLQQKFPSEVQGSYGVVRTIQWVQQQQQAGKDFMSRFFISSDKVIRTSDGEQMVVCNQWGDNFNRFIETAKEMGIDIVEANL